DRTVGMLSASASQAILVVTDEPTSLTDAYDLNNLGNAAGLAKNVEVVINMAASPAEGEKTDKTLLKACEKFIRLRPPMLGVVRHDPKVKDSIRHQTPLLIRCPNTDAAEDVEKIAASVWRAVSESRKKAATGG